MLPDILMDEDIKAWLKEDLPYWDLSSIPLYSKSKKVKASIHVKENGVLAGSHVCKRVFELLGVEIQTLRTEGDAIRKGDTIFNLNGTSEYILTGERTAINILSHMSGIATMVNKLTRHINSQGFHTKIAATRKTLPGLRKYQKWAVSVGGGDTHRFDLSSMALIKENHITSFDDTKRAISEIKKNISFSQKLEIEVTSKKQALEIVKYEVDVLMLDNFDPMEIKQVLPQLRSINPKIIVEASGNINESNFMNYVSAGVDIISMGMLTHSVKALDFSLLV